MNTKRISGYDSIKGLAIVLVCIGHILQSNFTDFRESRIFLLIYAVQMPLFIIVSGFFAIGDSGIDSISTWARKVGTRFIAYMVPFFSRIIFFEKVFHTNDISIHDRFSKIFLSSLDSGLWYLYVVFVLYFIISLAVLITKRLHTTNKWITFLCECVIYGAFLIPWCGIVLVKGTGFMGAKFVLYYSVFYFFGFCLKKYIDPVLDKTKMQEYLVAMSAIVGVWIACNCGDILAVEDTLTSVAQRMAAGLLLSYALIKVVLKYEKAFEKLKFDRIGQYTLEIYYVHGIAFSLMSECAKYKLYSIEGLTQLVFECLITTVYTAIIIAFIKSNSITDFVFFGKMKRNAARINHKRSGILEKQSSER